MRETLTRLLHPLNLAGIATWLAVAMVVRPGDMPPWRNDVLLLAWLLAFLGASAICERRKAWRVACFAIEAATTLALVWLADNRSTTPVLLVVLVAQMAMVYPLRVVLPFALAINVAIYLLLPDERINSGPFGFHNGQRPAILSPKHIVGETLSGSVGHSRDFHFFDAVVAESPSGIFQIQVDVFLAGCVFADFGGNIETTADIGFAELAKFPAQGFVFLHHVL